MKVIVAVCLMVSVASAAVLVRTPSLDSAVIQSDRLGGNFAYSHVEAPAYAAVSPVISHVPTPVAVSYNHVPIQVPVVAPAALPAYYAPSAPVFAAPAIIPGSPLLPLPAAPVPAAPTAPEAAPAPAPAPAAEEAAPSSDESESVSVEAAA
ncbi:predicted GPI-anchored protein 58 [Nilaparvata lugens]|uniref:predicted GPI-anchored protein 58 n=1 Tax=Nilaparvata lugens TaxID=108931 RepID=UPI00193CA019|nr:predicted GPI-anchored protein 58 [Nilaparvata lugens]